MFSVIGCVLLHLPSVCVTSQQSPEITTSLIKQWSVMYFMFFYVVEGQQELLAGNGIICFVSLCWGCGVTSHQKLPGLLLTCLRPQIQNQVYGTDFKYWLNQIWCFFFHVATCQMKCSEKWLELWVQEKLECYNFTSFILPVWKSLTIHRISPNGNEGDTTVYLQITLRVHWSVKSDPEGLDIKDIPLNSHSKLAVGNFCPPLVAMRIYVIIVLMKPTGCDIVLFL